MALQDSDGQQLRLLAHICNVCPAAAAVSILASRGAVRLLHRVTG
jgi:hypothetical protein